MKQSPDHREVVGASAFSGALRIAPQTDVGRPAVRAYAARAGQSVEEYLQSFVQSGGPLVTPEIAGASGVQLVRWPALNAPSMFRNGSRRSLPVITS